MYNRFIGYSRVIKLRRKILLRYPNYGPLVQSRASLTPSHKEEAALIIVRIIIKNNQEGQE